jgi:hypothetical protein
MNFKFWIKASIMAYFKYGPLGTPEYYKFEKITAFIKGRINEK